MSYRAWCDLCSLDTTCESLEQVLEIDEEHRAEYGDGHVVEFEKVD